MHVAKLVPALFQPRQFLVEGTIQQPREKEMLNLDAKANCLLLQLLLIEVVRDNLKSNTCHFKQNVIIKNYTLQNTYKTTEIATKIHFITICLPLWFVSV